MFVFHFFLILILILIFRTTEALNKSIKYIEKQLYKHTMNTYLFLPIFKQVLCQKMELKCPFYLLRYLEELLPSPINDEYRS